MNLLEEIHQVERDAELIYSMDQLESAIERIAAEINARLGGSNPILLTVLNGGIIFSGKLLSSLRFPLQIAAVKGSRYRGESRGGRIEWPLKPNLPLQGRTLLLMDDILDESIAMAVIKAW